MLKELIRKHFGMNKGVITSEMRVSVTFDDLYILLIKTYEYLENKMDKQIRNIEKTIKSDTKKEEKKLSKLESADKKRDKVCDIGKKVLQDKKKKK